MSKCPVYNMLKFSFSYGFTFSTVRNRKKPQEAAGKPESSDAFTEVWCVWCVCDYKLLFYRPKRMCCCLSDFF